MSVQNKGKVFLQEQKQNQDLELLVVMVKLLLKSIKVVF